MTFLAKLCLLSYLFYLLAGLLAAETNPPKTFYLPIYKDNHLVATEIYQHGNLWQRQVFTYNALGQVCKIATFQNHTLLHEEELFYTTAGKLWFTEITTNQSSTFHQNEHYLATKNAHLTLSASITATTQDYQLLDHNEARVSFHFQQAPWVLIITKRNPLAQSSSKQLFNRQMQLLSEQIFQNNRQQSLTQFSYLKDSNLLAEKTLVDSSGTEHRYQYHWDENQQLIGQEYWQNRQLRQKTIYTETTQTEIYYLNNIPIFTETLKREEHQNFNDSAP